MENDKIKELEALIIVLAKQIEDLRRKTVGGSSIRSDAQWLNELKKEAQKIKL